MSTPADPLINIRAKTQLVSEGISRFMGEQWQMPLREGLGLVGQGEAEQWIDPARPLVWAQNAPGPHEAWQLYGDPQTQGSREGAIGGGPGGVRGGAPGDQQRRQIAGQNTATFLQPQQYDDYRSTSTAGLSGPTDQWWQKGAIPPQGQALISPARAGAQAGQPTTEMPGAPPQRARQSRPPQRGPQPMPPRRHMPPQRGPGLTPPRPPAREERREARHERREDRYDQRHEERHERREDRYEKRHEASDNRREARHERRDERGEREARHERRDERGERSREGRHEGRRHDR